MVEAAKKRGWFIWYVDGLVIGAPLVIGFNLLGLEVSFWLALCVFMVIEAALSRSPWLSSPAAWALRTFRDGDRLVVDTDHAARERWIPMLVATLLLWDGFRGMTRWSETLLAGPIFGHTFDPWLYGALSTGLGALSSLAGLLVLRLHPAGLVLLVVLAIASAADLMLSAPLVRDALIARLDATGRVLAAEEIDLVLSLSARFSWGTMALSFTALAYVRQFRARS